MILYNESNTLFNKLYVFCTIFCLDVLFYSYYICNVNLSNMFMRPKGENIFTNVLELLKVKHTNDFSNRCFNEHPHKYNLFAKGNKRKLR